MDNHCISKIREIFRVITAFECGLQEQIGLNINEAMLLCLLSESENPIAEEMDLTRSNTSKVIASLEQASLIRRRACSEDGRCQRFHITKHGLEKLDHLHCDSIAVPEELKEII